jgi:hypothetical protein
VALPSGPMSMRRKMAWLRMRRSSGVPSRYARSACSTRLRAISNYLLTDRPEGQRHWSVQEVGNEIESQGAAADALHALARAGLIHRDSDNFVFATRSAIRFRELIGEAFV